MERTVTLIIFQFKFLNYCKRISFSVFYPNTFFQLPLKIAGSVLSEYAPDFIKFIADVIINPAFPANELERLKSDLKRQLSVQKAEPRKQAAEKFRQAIYKGQPYGRFFPTEEMLTSYSLQMVKDFYNKNFGAKRSVLYIAGKFNEAAVNEALEAAFSKWKPGPDVMYPPVKTYVGGDTAIIDCTRAPQTTVIIGLPTLTPKDKDYIPQIIANPLLGGAFISRITTNIRESKRYTYSPYSFVQNNHGTLLWIEQADVTSEHTIDAMREIKKEINRLQTEGPSKEEVTGIQNFEAGVFVLRNSSPNGIIGQLNFIDQYGLDDSYLTNLVKNLYAVTPEKVSEIARNDFKYENMKLVMIGDKETIQQQIKASKAERAF